MRIRFPGDHPRPGGRWARIRRHRSQDRPPATGRFGRRWPGRRLRPVAWRSPIRALRKPPVGLPPLRWAWLRRVRLPGVILALLGVTIFASATWAATQSPLFDVDRIDVLGAAAVAPEDLVATSGIRRGQPLFGVDPAAAEARLEAVPWVASARVERSFPNRVRIHVSEREPAATVARPTGGFAVVDDTGRILADHPERPAGLPELAGAGDVPAPGWWLEATRPALDVLGALPPALRQQATTAAIADGAVTVWLAGREVRFGPAEDLQAKTAALEALLVRLGDRPVLFIDVRVPSAPVVGPDGPAGQTGSGADAAPDEPAPRD